MAQPRQLAHSGPPLVDRRTPFPFHVINYIDPPPPSSALFFKGDYLAINGARRRHRLPGLPHQLPPRKRAASPPHPSRKCSHSRR